MTNLRVQIASGDPLDVRQFSVHERLSSLFQIDVVALTTNRSLRFDDIVGRAATFTVEHTSGVRFWQGICADIQLVQVAQERSAADNDSGSSAHTYHLSIVPELWLATQKRNYKIFQQKSELDIVLELLEKHWRITPVLRVDREAYKKRDYRVQYAETDYAFISRMLEDAGISFYFEQDQSGTDASQWETKLVLNDAPHESDPRTDRIPFVQSGSSMRAGQHLSEVRISQQVRPGSYTMRDYDFRRAPSYKLMSTAQGGLPAEASLERFHYRHGAFLYRVDQAPDEPMADDRGVTRADEKQGKALARRRLDAARNSAWSCSFRTNAHDLAPGTVFGMLDHPHETIGDDALLLILDCHLSGSANGEWTHHCEARSCAFPYRPPIITPKPRTYGVESATVVGPVGEEIHVDEFGRVRVHFHWDRDSQMNEKSTCWIPVSQSWAGARYGWSTLPRVGHQVLIDFFGADPDCPVVIGRVYSKLQPTPYPLPQNKTKSGWKSSSSPGGGGFNEISFEDKKGSELVYMQAEKDLRRLVKNNESVTIGNNRTHKIACNGTLTVGASRTHTVGVNETIRIGRNQTTTIGANHKLKVHAHQTMHVVKDRKLIVDENAVTTIAGGHNLIVGNGIASTEPEAGKLKIEAENEIEITCGASKLVMKKDGKVTLDGTEFTFISTGPARYNSGAATTIEAGADLTIQGGPMVLINP